jgi:membrane-bound lytic murein transglycosylase B
MIRRRLLLAAAPALFAGRTHAASDSFAAFLARVSVEASRQGIADATIAQAFAGVQPNQQVIQHYTHQPEFTMTWAQYRAMLVTAKRIQEGQAALDRNRRLLAEVRRDYGVSSGTIMGIWGLESSFGQKMGDYHVVEALATLAWYSNRSGFFRSELIAALKILNHRDVVPAQMLGSYAGAMGQPQFMPSSYLRYAVDFTGTGQRNIWTSVPDVLASIANYLEKNGWRRGEAWGQQVSVPSGFTTAGRDDRRPVGEWLRLRVHPLGTLRASPVQNAALVMPDGPGGDAFLVYGNFAAIRRYNPSDFYALAVGLIGDGILA